MYPEGNNGSQAPSHRGKKKPGKHNCYKMPKQKVHYDKGGRKINVQYKVSLRKRTCELCIITYHSFIQQEITDNGDRNKQKRNTRHIQ